MAHTDFPPAVITLSGRDDTGDLHPARTVRVFECQRHHLLRTRAHLDNVYACVWYVHVYGMCMCMVYACVWYMHVYM